MNPTSRRRRAGRLVIPSIAPNPTIASLSLWPIQRTLLPATVSNSAERCKERRCNCVKGVVYRRTNGGHASAKTGSSMSTTSRSRCWGWHHAGRGRATVAPCSAGVYGPRKTMRPRLLNYLHGMSPGRPSQGS
jgi:hypothetical protein